MSTLKFNRDRAFAAYRLPNESYFTLVTGEVVEGMPVEGGFVVQAFDKSSQTTSYIKPDQVNRDAVFAVEVEESCEVESTEVEDYLKVAQETIDVIKRGDFEKIVISKIKVVQREEGDLYELFCGLKDAYPSAFVFLYQVPGQGVWCGATPELLLKADDVQSQDGVKLTTMALAGTQVDSGLPLEEVKWGDKEIHEQRVIEEFVATRLTDQKISYHKEGPVTVTAGQVLHLKSTFTMDGAVDPMSVVNALHPGPAICGRPQAKAMNWIIDKERHDREHYCGYIGPWNIENQRALYINLRSMRVYNDAYVLYLGGGLTADSEASSEWSETELKGKTLLSVIRKTTAHSHT